MSWNARNLANTVENRPMYQTQPCPFPRAKGWPYTMIAAEEDDPEERQRTLFDHCHSWDDRAGGLKGGRCTRCGKTLKEVRVRINPKTGEPVRRASRLAREIALTPADVPPVFFIGTRG